MVPARPARLGQADLEMSCEMSHELLERAKPLFNELTACLGVNLPKQTQIKFNQVFFLALRKENARLKHLLSESRKTDWFSRFTTSISETEMGLRATYYHAHNVSVLEHQAGTIAVRHLPHLGMVPGQGISGGMIIRSILNITRFCFPSNVHLNISRLRWLHTSKRKTTAFANSTTFCQKPQDSMRRGKGYGNASS